MCPPEFRPPNSGSPEFRARKGSAFGSKGARKPCFGNLPRRLARGSVDQRTHPMATPPLRLIPDLIPDLHVYTAFSESAKLPKEMEWLTFQRIEIRSTKTAADISTIGIRRTTNPCSRKAVSDGQIPEE
jgi:hypothetical protein